jgi:hypothetical protein
MRPLGGHILTRLAIVPDDPGNDDNELERTIRALARGPRPD